ncbi:hypothetical protein NJ7G_1126 [Natrinema sp. J7-2]|nr:hypothetical protein NJ7G_1126 [Natrinema sp. J7-2]
MTVPAVSVAELRAAGSMLGAVGSGRRSIYRPRSSIVME